MRKLIIVLYILIATNLSAKGPLKIAVISDIHYLSTKVAQPGASLKQFEESTGRNVKELHQVLNLALFNLKAHQSDILLIPGDLTNNGELNSHLDFAAQLEPLKESGTRIFVVPGNHDVNVPNAKAFIGEKSVSTESVSAKEFTEIYAPYGYAEATMRDSTSLSYLAEINDSTWLLAFDSNKYNEHTTTTISSGRIHPNTLHWALEILRQAKSKNILVLGMMHHGLIEHMPYQSTFMPNYLIDDWENTATILANKGLKIIFTGHFHSNDVTLFKTNKENTIYDVETGSLAGYPFPYRLMKLENNKLHIESYFIDSIPSNTNLQEEYRIKTKKIAKHVAKSKIESLSLPLATDMKDTLVKLLVKMQMLHMKGDEKIDPEMLQMIQQLNKLIGDAEADFSTFELDFPPADNFLTIDL